MKKEIRVVDQTRGVFQVTMESERYYSLQVVDPLLGIPTYRFLPSVTYITGFYPKGKFFEAFLKKQGDDAEVIKMLAAEKGSRVHNAISALMNGEVVTINSTFADGNSQELKELNADEYNAVYSFVKWFDAVKPKILNKDYLAVNETVGYAGSVDAMFEINGEKWIVDFKTSKAVYPSHELQLSAYKHTPGNEDCKLGILQVGYTLNKAGYKFTEVTDKFDLFLSVHQIFLNEEGNKTVKQIELPMSMKLDLLPTTSAIAPTQGDDNVAITNETSNTGWNGQVSKNTNRKNRVPVTVRAGGL